MFVILWSSIASILLLPQRSTSFLAVKKLVSTIIPRVGAIRRMFSLQEGKGDSQEISSDESENNLISEDFFGNTSEMTRNLIARKIIDHQTQRLTERELCPKCYLTKLFCICNRTEELYKPIRDIAHSALPLKIHLFTHYKEWGRASNTGKLLAIGLPEQTSVKIYGLKDDEESLINELSQNPSIILYPTKESISIHEFIPIFREIQQQREAKVERFENVVPNRKRNLFHICVIDSTWLQSRSMEKIFPPSIPRVHINEYVSQPSKFLNRKQSKNKSKISTIESIILTLSALEISSMILTTLFQSLEYAVDSLLRQNGRATVYGNHIQPQFSNQENSYAQKTDKIVKERGPYIKPAIIKPSHCLHCNSQIDDITQIVNFKNCGVRTRKRDLEHLTLEMEIAHRESVEKVMNEAISKTEDVFRLNSLLTVDLREKNLVTMKDILLTAPTFRVWKCSICNQFFPCPDSSV